MWVMIIVHEENLLILQIRPLVTDVGFQLVKGLAVVLSVHIGTFWNVMGQEYSSRAQKTIAINLPANFPTFFARFTPNHSGSF